MRAVLAIITLAIILVIPLSLLAYLDSTENDFNNGTYNGTWWNSSGYVELNESAGNHSMNGTFISRALGNGYYNIWKNISWNANLTHGNLSFQTASGNNQSDLTQFLGPDGTGTTHYDASGQSLNLSVSKYLSYITYLNTTNISNTPWLYNVTIGYIVIVPKVESITPSGVENLTNDITFSFNVSSPNIISNCTLYVNGSMVQANETPIINGTVNNITITIGNGEYNWSVQCSDPIGNQNSSTITYFNVSAPDIIPPTITLNTPLDAQSGLGNDMTFNCTVSDNNLSNVSLYGNWSGGWHKNSSNTSGSSGDYLFLLSLDNGTYLWACYACDAQGNCISSGNRTIGIGLASLELVSTTPITGSTNATVETPIKLIFNKALQNATIDGSIVMSSQLGPVSLSYLYDNATLSVNLTPTLSLHYNTTYTVSVLSTLKDSEGGDATPTNINFTTEDMDTDSDGTPDYIDADDDGDGTADATDTITGSASDIRTNDASIIVEINGSTDMSIPYNGTYTVTINNSNGTLTSFDLSFTIPNALDFRNLTIVTDEISGTGTIAISGLSTTKTIRILDVDGMASDACLKDSPLDSIDSISANCDGQDETFVRCNGTTTSGYTCTAGNGYIEITGATHTGAVEICQEEWECEKWIPLYCFLGMSQGRDCTDVNACGTNQFKPTVSQYCTSRARPRGCRAEWECLDWGECIDGTRTRTCNNVGRCPDHVKTPIMEETCTPKETSDAPAVTGNAIQTNDPSSGQTPNTEQPTTNIFDSTPVAVIKNSPSYLYWIVILINVVIVAGFIIYKIRPQNSAAGNYTGRHEPQPEGLLVMKLKRAKRIARLNKQKNIRKTEIEEIKKIATETKEMGLDSTRHRFMASKPLDPPKIAPPEKPTIHKVGITDKLFFKLFKVDIKPEKPANKPTIPPIKQEKTPSAIDVHEQLTVLKSRMQKEEKRKGVFDNVLDSISKAEFPKQTGKVMADDASTYTKSAKLRNKIEVKGISELEKSSIFQAFINDHTDSLPPKQWKGFLKTIKDEGYIVNENELKQFVEMEQKRLSIKTKLKL